MDGHQEYERKAKLQRLLARSNSGIQHVTHVEGDGAKLFDALCKLGLEGIVSKRLAVSADSRLVN